MRCEAPDLRFYGELQDLNREFLHLIIEGRQGSRPVLGLAPEVAGRLCQFEAPQLDAVAATPCLLATLAASAAEPFTTGVRDGSEFGEARWVEATRVYAASLGTYVWQTAPRGALLAALCGAPPVAAGQPVPAAAGTVRAFARVENRRLEARFHRHPRFWPDLVAAAAAGNAERMRLAQLTAVQLSLHGDGRVALRQAAPVPGPRPAGGPAIARSVPRTYSQR